MFPNSIRPWNAVYHKINIPLYTWGSEHGVWNTVSIFIDPCMEENIQNILLAVSLNFDSTNCFVYCTTCNIILLANAKRHVSKFHHKKLSKKSFQNVEEFILLNPPNLTVYNNIKKNVDLVALPYLKTFKGFKCMNCFYCFIEDSCFRKHKCTNEAKNITVKYLQSFNVLNHSPFFSVQYNLAGDSLRTNLPNISKVATSMVLKTKLNFK